MTLHFRRKSSQNQYMACLLAVLLAICGMLTYLIDRSTLIEVYKLLKIATKRSKKIDASMNIVSIFIYSLFLSVNIVVVTNA